jgi:hypothetical protein
MGTEKLIGKRYDENQIEEYFAEKMPGYFRASARAMSQ